MINFMFRSYIKTYGFSFFVSGIINVSNLILFSLLQFIYIVFIQNKILIVRNFINILVILMKNLYFNI